MPQRKTTHSKLFREHKLALMGGREKKDTKLGGKNGMRMNILKSCIKFPNNEI